MIFSWRGRGAGRGGAAGGNRAGRAGDTGEELLGRGVDFGGLGARRGDRQGSHLVAARLCQLDLEILADVGDDAVGLGRELRIAERLGGYSGVFAGCAFR